MLTPGPLNILWISPKWPNPPIDGARLASFQLLKGLAPLANIDMILIAEDPQCQIPSPDLLLNNVWAIQKPPKNNIWQSLWLYLIHFLKHPKIPLTTASFFHPQCKRQLAKVMDEIQKSAKHYHYMIIDGMHPSAIFYQDDNFQWPSFVSKIAYRAHNIEALLWPQAAAMEKNIIKKILLYWQASLVKAFEHKLLKNSNLALPISSEDLEIIKKDHPKLPTFMLPMIPDFRPTPLPLPEGKALKLLFLGRLDWPPNRQGLLWFLKHVWPKVVQKRKDIQLIIAGSGSLDFKAKYEHLPQVDWRGFAPSITPLFEESIVLLVPVFFGSGTRIKILESCAHGRAVLSTSFAVQGSMLQNEHFIKADTEEEWAQQICSVNVGNWEKIGHNAYNFLRERINNATVMYNLQQFLKSKVSDL